MKIYACLATLCFFVFSVGALAQPISGPITNSANGHLYYLLNGFVSWGDAQATAVAMNGHLATIRSEGENQWLQNAFRPAVGAAGPLWIGLNDLEVEDAFVWSSGAPLTYSNWEPGAPDNLFGSEDAVCLLSSGQWNDSVDNFIGLVEGAIIEVIPPPPIVVQIQFTTNALISWNSQSNLQYQVQYTSQLTSNSWTNHGTTVTATGTNSTITDSDALQTHQFYRVVQIP